MSLAIVNPNGPKCGGGRISHRRPQVENLKKLQFKIVKFWFFFYNFGFSRWVVLLVFIGWVGDF